MKLKQKLHEIFGADLRSLALLRMGVASLLLADLILRAQDLKAHYTDFGILPRYALLEKFTNPWWISLHLMSGSLWIQALLFLIAGFFACGLLLGYRTRAMSVLSWFFLISLQSRNPIILQGGDVLLRMLAFWGMFLPWGACYSVDSALDTSPRRKPLTVVSLGILGFYLQVVFVYVFTFLLKSGVEWKKDFTAVYYGLGIDQFATPLGHVLFLFPPLLKILTFLVISYEAIGPVLLFFPLATGRVRTAAIFGFIFMQIAFGSCLLLGPFPWICSVSMFGFFPPCLWEKIFKLLEKSHTRRRLTIYYDGDCGFCKKSVMLLRTFFLWPETEVHEAQTDPSIYAGMQAYHSWVVVDSEGARHYKFEAAIAVGESSPVLRPFAPLFRLPLISRAGNKIYEAVASRRPLFARLLAPFKFRPWVWETSRPMDLLAVLFLIYVLVWNINELPHAKFPGSKLLGWIGPVFRVDQRWDMFSPYPLKEDGWYVIPGKLKDGTEVDLFKKGAPVNWEKPKRVYEIYKNERWRKYMMNLWAKANADYRLYYGQYLCRSWNRVHPEPRQVEEFEIIFMLENTLPPGYVSQSEKVSLWKHYCFKVPEETRKSGEKSPLPGKQKA